MAGPILFQSANRKLDHSCSLSLEINGLCVGWRAQLIKSAHPTCILQYLVKHKCKAQHAYAYGGAGGSRGYR